MKSDCLLQLSADGLEPDPAYDHHTQRISDIC